MIKKQRLIVIFLYGISIWFVPTPEGLTDNAWHLFAIFSATILGIILEALPIGAMGFLSIGIVALSGVTNDGGSKQNIIDALSSLSNSFIWLIVLATIMSRAIIKTGLGERIAYYMLILFGKSTLGTAYALTLAELLLAPFTPSNTARGGGIIHPIMKGVADSLKSYGHDDSRKKAGRFLALVNYNVNPITSAMFITATAPNPIIVNAVSEVTNGSIELTWTKWALAMLLPSLIALVLIPIIINAIYPSSTKKIENIKEYARNKISEKGSVTKNEKIVIGVFGFLLVFWAQIPSYFIGIELNTTTTILIGVIILILTQVLKWDDILSEKTAWNTLVWFSALVMMASFLKTLGFIDWFSTIIQQDIQKIGLNSTGAMILLTLIYLYAHYLFASTTAHITAMFATFYGVGIALGANPLNYALILAASSSVMMHLTHYATGTSPIIFSSGYVTLKEWWTIGFILSITSSLIYWTIGMAWWSFIF